MLARVPFVSDCVLLATLCRLVGRMAQPPGACCSSTSRIVVACTTLSVSARSSGAIGASHTSANGSARVFCHKESCTASPFDSNVVTICGIQ